MHPLDWNTASIARLSALLPSITIPCHAWDNAHLSHGTMLTLRFEPVELLQANQYNWNILIIHVFDGA